MKLNNIKNNKKSGFTLIELMVSTSIFVVIMLASMGALFTLLGSSKDARALRISMDNVNFAMESMTRSIRMGKNFYCEDDAQNAGLEETKDCNQENFPGNIISFVPQNGTDRLTYKLKERSGDDNTNTLQRCVGQTCVDLVAENVDITKLTFYVQGSDPGADEMQAGIYIMIQGKVAVKEDKIPFSLQTFSSMRNFN